MLMNKPVYVSFAILQMSKTEIYEACYGYVKQKYRENAKLCYMDTHSFILYIKQQDISINITKDVETRFDTSNYELDRPLPKRKKGYWINKRWIKERKKWQALLHWDQKHIVI